MIKTSLIFILLALLNYSCSSQENCSISNKFSKDKKILELSLQEYKVNQAIINSSYEYKMADGSFQITLKNIDNIKLSLKHIKDVVKLGYIIEVKSDKLILFSSVIKNMDYYTTKKSFVYSYDKDVNLNKLINEEDIGCVSSIDENWSIVVFTTLVN